METNFFNILLVGLALFACVFIYGVVYFLVKYTKDKKSAQVEDSAREWSAVSDKIRENRIMNRRIKIKAKLSQNKRKPNDSDIEGVSSFNEAMLKSDKFEGFAKLTPSERIKALAGTISEEELLQDRKQRESILKGTMSAQLREKSTNELLDEYEVRNGLSNVESASDLIDFK